MSFHSWQLKHREDLEKYEGKWIRKVEIWTKKKFLAVDEASMPENICQVWILSKGDLNFCICSTPLQDHCQEQSLTPSVKQFQLCDQFCSSCWGGQVNDCENNLFNDLQQEGACLHFSGCQQNRKPKLLNSHYVYISTPAYTTLTSFRSRQTSL